MKIGLPKIVAALLSIAFLCSGCGTIYTHPGGDPDFGDMLGAQKSGIYRGVRLDCDAASGGNLYGVVDFPLSLTADTFTFPFDLATIHNQQTRQTVGEQITSQQTALK